jgi:hypothetical protein
MKSDTHANPEPRSDAVRERRRLDDPNGLRLIRDPLDTEHSVLSRLDSYNVDAIEHSGLADV